MAERIVQEVLTHANYAMVRGYDYVLAKKRQSRSRPRCPPYAGKNEGHRKLVSRMTKSARKKEKKKEKSHKSTRLPSIWRSMTSWIHDVADKRMEISKKSSFWNTKTIVSLLPLATSWRSSHRLAIFDLNIAFSNATSLFESAPETRRCGRKFLPISYSHSYWVQVLSKLAIVNITSEPKWRLRPCDDIHHLTASAFH